MSLIIRPNRILGTRILGTRTPRMRRRKISARSRRRRERWCLHTGRADGLGIPTMIT